MAKQKSEKKPRKSTKTTKSRGKTKQTGLGDTVEKVLETTGVAKVVKFLAGEDCGCSDRREILNKAFPYQKPNCLLEDEYKYLTEYFDSKPNRITIERQKELVGIYNRVFNDKANTTSCTSCFLNNVHKKLERVYKEYEA
jgi:hypothetical protein